MHAMRSFFQRHLDPSSRIGEAMFGLIMALGIIGAVRLGSAEASSRQLFLDVLGCNVAWGIVDGVMFVMLALFERGRKARIVRSVLSTPNDDAIERIHLELGDRLEPLTTPDERRQIYQWVLNLAKRTSREEPRIQREDILGGIAVGSLILVMTLPILVPFVLFSNPVVAVRLSNLITLALLFWLGLWWAAAVGAPPVRTSLMVTSVGLGLVLVLLTIALGG